MRAPLFKRAVAVAATLCAALAPSLLARPALAADVAGPATCYLADENDNILEPRREYVPNDGAGEIPVHPSPVVTGQYTLEISAPALNFDPDQPDVHFVCEVFYSALGSVRLVDADGTVLAAQRYGNDPYNPSRAAATPLPALPEGYEIVPGQAVFGYDAAAGTVDPNNPAHARAVGVNTDIQVRKVAADPTPEPSPSNPVAPVTGETPAPTPRAPETPTPAESTTPAPSTPMSPTPAASSPTPRLAHTGADASGLTSVVAFLALLGVSAVAVRRFRG